MFYDILEGKNAFLSYKKKKFKKSKNGHFFNFVFSGNIGQENVFYDILERKNAFLSFKNKKFKKSKIDIFSSWFLSKIRQNRVRRCISRYARKKKRSF